LPEHTFRTTTTKPIVKILPKVGVEGWREWGGGRVGKSRGEGMDCFIRGKNIYRCVRQTQKPFHGNSGLKKTRESGKGSSQIDRGGTEVARGTITVGKTGGEIV